MSERRYLQPEDLATSPTYSHVVAARGSETVFVSGQVAIDTQGKLVGSGDLGAQTEQVMENLSIALAAAGATFDDVVKITTFVVDYEPAHRAVIAQVRGRYLSTDNPPASTLLGVSALAAPEYLIEIEATAVLD